MLIITIALAGTAYMFMSGLIASRISKPITIMGGSCNTSNYITLVISNDGTERIDKGEINIYIGSEYKGKFNASIEPHDVNITSDLKGNSGSNLVRAMSPSVSVDFPVWC